MSVEVPVKILGRVDEIDLAPKDDRVAIRVSVTRGQDDGHG